MVGGFVLDLFVLRNVLLDLKPLSLEMCLMLALLMAFSVVYAIFAGLFEEKAEKILLKLQRKLRTFVEKTLPDKPERSK